MSRKRAAPDLSAAKQRRYRAAQRAQGIPTADLVAIATFHVMMSRYYDQGARRTIDHIEGLVTEFILSRHRRYTSSGIERRFEAMVQEAVFLRDHGWLDGIGEGNAET